MNLSQKRAAPVAKTADVVDLVIECVSAGTPLAEVCREKWAPHPSTWYDWINEDTELDRRFARAREIGQAAIEAHSRLVARGEQGYSSGDVKRDKLIIDANEKMIDRWDRRYADKPEGSDVSQLGSLLDPRTGLYFASPDEGLCFFLATLFARAEQRTAQAEGAPDKAGHFTMYLAREGFPDLAECEAALDSENGSAARRSSGPPTVGPVAQPNNGSDLA